MTRAKKSDEPKVAELVISIDQFTRTRDSVVTGLTQLQNAVGDLLRAYINHTNSVLGGGTGTLDTLAISNPTALSVPNPPTGSTPVPAIDVKQRRKREKKEKDPNAPKRPLTAAFLYMQSARPIVKADLESQIGAGQKLEPNAVNSEVNRRWNELPDSEKEAWKDTYRKNMEQYREELKEYQANTGQLVDAQLEDEAQGHEDAAAALVNTGDDSEVSEPTPAPPPKAPTPPVNKPKSARKPKGKANGTTPAAVSSPVPPPSAAKTDNKRKKKVVEKETPVEEPKKKKPRKSKGAEEVPEPPKEPETPVEKKVPRRGKRKTDGSTA